MIQYTEGIMRQKKKGYGLWLIITIIFSLATLSSLVPQASASKACYLGYYAHCTFTPISTVICLLIAGFACVIRKKKYTVEE